MTGLLHRLAQRATGTAALVRSDARLPNVRGGLPWVDNGDAVQEVAAGMRDDKHGQGAVASRARAAAVQNAAVAPSDSAAKASKVDAVPVGAVLKQSAAQALRPSTTPQPLRPLSTQSEAATQATVASDPTARRPATPEQQANARPELQTASTSQPAIDHPQLRNAMQRDPTPLLPPRPTSDEARLPPIPRHAQRDMRQSQAAQTPVQSDQAPEVHVHIGRIEVTAHRPAQPAARKASSIPAPMTLDAYLARRSGTS